MNAGRTARDRARAELTTEIKAVARRQLAVTGAAGLSLRAVARELDMVSSAIYRYFPSKDELLTALIIDAYNNLGDVVDAADQANATSSARHRWLMACRAVRMWAKAEPHQYALIYGSPVPGYRAPEDTIASASRVPLTFVRILRDAGPAGELHVPSSGPTQTPVLAKQTEALAAQLAPELPGWVLAKTIVAWTQLFGMVSFELFGQLVGSVDPADEFFEYAVAQLADMVGLVRQPLSAV